MKCPKCGDGRLKYNIVKKKIVKGMQRLNPASKYYRDCGTAVCKQCGWEGEI